MNTLNWKSQTGIFASIIGTSFLLIKKILLEALLTKQSTFL